jgi:predicted AAA+ superfamily ATPase
LILGSASRDLLKQSSETLAGRIGYVEMAPFILQELSTHDKYILRDHWLKGGFPESYLQKKTENSLIWRENFIRTYVERDIPQLGLNIPALTSRRFLTICAHNQGQVLNSSKLGEALGVTHHTIKNYIDFLEHTYLIRVLPTFETNVKKRIIKSPKVYIRDSGILHALLSIPDFNTLLGHPVFGMSWEGFGMENILTGLSHWEAYFYRTSSGNEIDLILKKGNRKVAIEFKATTAPGLTKGFFISLNELDIDEAYLVAIVDDEYALKNNVIVTSINGLLSRLKDS